MESAPPSIDQACTQYASSVCNALGTCGSLALQLFYGDNPTCVTRQKLSCTTDQMASGINRTTTDIVTCAQAVSGASCTDVLAQNFPSACQVTPGTVPNGGSCGSSWQCQSTHCEKPGAACGTCAARQPASGSCSSDDGCNVGLVCANKKCVVPGGVGATCSDNNPCRGNLYCTGTGTCAPLVEVGGSCADSASACDLTNGAGCNPINKTCAAVAIAKGGEACGIVNGTLTLCVEGDALSQPHGRQSNQRLRQPRGRRRGLRHGGPRSQLHSAGDLRDDPLPPPQRRQLSVTGLSGGRIRP